MTSSRLRALLPDAPPTEGNRPETVSGHPSQPVTQQGTKQRAPRRRREDTRGHIRLNQALVTFQVTERNPNRRRHATATNKGDKRDGEPRRGGGTQPTQADDGRGTENPILHASRHKASADRPRPCASRRVDNAEGDGGTKSRGCENDPLRMQRTHRPYQAEGHGTTHAGADGAPQDGRGRGETP